MNVEVNTLNNHEKLQYQINESKQYRSIFGRNVEQSKRCNCSQFNVNWNMYAHERSMRNSKDLCLKIKRASLLFGVACYQLNSNLKLLFSGNHSTWYLYDEGQQAQSTTGNVLLSVNRNFWRVSNAIWICGKQLKALSMFLIEINSSPAPKKRFCIINHSLILHSFAYDLSTISYLNWP